MSRLSIGAAWNETAAFARRHGGTLILLAFGLVIFPFIALQSLLPDTLPAAGEPPPGAGLFVLALPVVLIVALAGVLAISSLAVGSRDLVGQAIGHGFRRVLPYLASSLLLGVALVLLLVPLVLVGGFQPGAAPPQQVSGSQALLLAAMMVLMLVLSVRMMLMSAVAVAEPVGPIGILRRSWELTRGRFWKLLGLTILLNIAAYVLILAVTSVAGILIVLIAGQPDPGSLSELLLLLVIGLLYAIFLVIYMTMVARIYLQVAPRTAGVFD